MDASQADPALLTAMRHFLSQAEAGAGGQAAAYAPAQAALCVLMPATWQKCVTAVHFSDISFGYPGSNSFLERPRWAMGQVLGALPAPNGPC